MIYLYTIQDFHNADPDCPGYIVTAFEMLEMLKNQGAEGAVKIAYIMSLCSPHNNKLFIIFMSFGQRKSLIPNKIEYIAQQKYWLSSLSSELRKGLPVHVIDLLK